MKRYCDLIYSEIGHYDDDYKFFNSFCDGVLEHIKCNIKQMSFFDKWVFFRKLLSTKTEMIIASTSFIWLLFFSIIFNNFNYILQIHFVPTSKVFIDKYVIKILVKKAKRITVLSPAVKIDILNLIGDKYKEKILEVHSRNVVYRNKVRKQEKKISISIIGAINSVRNYCPILKAIDVQQYSNIEFHFYSKGINEYLRINNYKNICNNTILIKDTYLDNDEYKKAFEASDYIILSQSSDYGIRFSGVMFDALDSGTAIIANNNLSFTTYIEKYKCGYVFNDYFELASILLKINNGVLSIDSFIKTLYTDFSPENNKKLAILGYL